MNTINEGIQDYFSSAKGVRITRERALFELKGHGISEPNEVQQFYTACGNAETYEAQEVLKWLGY